MSRLLRIQLVLLCAVVAFFALGMTAARATVEPGWPAGKPNTPRYANDVFLDFEKGIDGVDIYSSIPSLKFTTTSQLNWRYADIRTGAYAVYPYGKAAYETNGNVFAWLGQTGHQGRIDFLGEGATYCSVLVSTSSGLIIDAYDGDGTKIADSGWAVDNTFTRTLTRLTVDAPAGKTMSYIVIHDTGGFWLIDDLCTDANKTVIPVPGRTIGSHADKIDVVFVPDTDYGAAADIDTWLPTFLDHINDQIDQRLGAADPVTGDLCKFNFYYAILQGDAVDEGANTLPGGLTLLSPFAEAYVIFHNQVFDDHTSGNPPVYGAEGPVGRSFIHESGHGIFGVADEYNGCKTTYFMPDPFPNIWSTEGLGQWDAYFEGWDPDQIWKFTECQGDWWKLGTTKYIMWDGRRFASGWGPPAERRIQWVLDQYPRCTSEPAFPVARAVWLGLRVSDDAFTLLDDSFVLEAPPNYLPGVYDLTVEVLTTSGAPAGRYGIKDPRAVFAEQGYAGPVWLTSTDFSVVLPYFSNGGRVDLTESESGEVLLSIDISRYVDPLATPPVVDAGPDQTVEEADEVHFAGTATDPGGDPMSYEWDFGDGTTASGTLAPTHVYDHDGVYTVRLTVTDDEPAVSVDYMTVTVLTVNPTRFEVTAQTPSPGGTGVAIDTDVTATFAQAINPASLNETSFFLERSDSGDWVDVDASVSYDDPTKTAMLDPDADLDYSTQYRVALTTGVEGADGTPLPSAVSWTFTTESGAASSFRDVSPGDPYHAAITGLAGQGIVSGYMVAPGLWEFRPDNAVWRAQFAKMIDGALGLQVTEDDDGSPFTDLGTDILVPSAGQDNLYPHEYVTVAWENGITIGKTATTFAPYEEISRAQVVTMVVRAVQNLRPGMLATPPVVYTNTWGTSFSPIHGPNARIAEFNDLLAGLPLTTIASDPWTSMPRGEVAQVLWNMMGLVP